MVKVISRLPPNPATNSAPARMRVCFFDQNPLAIESLITILPRGEFEVLGESEILCRNPLSRGEGLVLAFDAQILSSARWKYIHSLRNRFPGAKLLVLGKELPQAFQLLRGIDGFLLYGEVKEKLEPALRALCAGHMWLPREVLERLAQLAAEAPHPKESTDETFTAREKDVIALLKEGFSNKEIANSLGICERTTKFHLENIYDKVGTHDRRSAAKIADSWNALRAKQQAA